MKHLIPCAGLWVAAALTSATPAVAETHSNLQAVDATGASAWAGTFPFTIRGVLLCNPDEMLDSTPNFLPWDGGANMLQLGAEWQVTIQATEPGDQGGTTCWMGQSYGNMPWLHDSDLSYTNEAWVSEILRLNFDPSNLNQFRAGDLVEITVNQAEFYGGKRNINEAHNIDPASNFEIRLVTANYGLPTPAAITLADVVQPGGTAADPSSWPAIFDQTRATGGELYQGTRTRIDGLTLVTTNGWNPTNAWGARLCTVTDGAGRYFSLRHPRYSLGTAPTASFDAIGIFNQESGSGSQGTNGYELFVQQIVLPPPALEIALNAAVAWPANGTEYVLESSIAITNAPWTTVTNTPSVINGKNTVLLPVAEMQRFFSLRSAP